jgi:hypothetical protein
LKNTKTSLVNILIDFFASLYDFVIALFASIYDLVYAFIIFLWEYLKWITTISSAKSTDFNSHVEEPIKVHCQNPFEIQ